MDDFNALPKVVGLKQTLKNIKAGRIEKVILASDSDDFIIEEVKRTCEAQSVPILSAESKRALGKACGIERAAAVVGILK